MRTGRLVLEPMRREDSGELFAAVVSQGSVMRWLATGHADSRSAAEAMCEAHVAHWERYGYGDFAVREATSRAFLGRVGLRNRACHGTDLGFALHPRAQGRGIAGEAGRACLDLAFHRLALPAVFAFVLPGNAASIALLRRLGAREAGTVRSSGLDCLRYRFDPPADGATAPDEEEGLLLRHGPGWGGGELGLVRAELEHTLTAVEGGRPVGSLGWLVRDMSFDGVPRRVVGVGGVLVDPAHRGRGIGRTMLGVAVEHGREAGAGTAMLLCRPEWVPLCTRLGWRELAAPVTFRRPTGSPLSPLTTMTYDLAELPRPTVGVDLLGLPF
ncbi:GNAT family N-acetyltransferase [Streptomyces sp. NPDC058045]|uniref:GNAT family N-acetyltransferase n=1 Tax=Streptomyces sp. NPDC058045 TaxID=3346311 RepID=UPI0036EA2EEE